MSRSLAETQRIFAHALVDAEARVPPGITGLRGRDEKRRFAIYRNNVAVSLADALADAFPVTAALVGEAFFRAMAGEFARAKKPESPILFRYGDDFPEFVGSFEPARGLPYLPDVARLETAWTSAYHAADASPCPVSALVSFGEAAAEARAIFIPSVRIVVSQFPVGTIWLAHQAGGPAAPELWVPEIVLISRPEMDVEVSVLTGEWHAFIAALVAGKTIGEAALAALAVTDGFDPGSALVELVKSGIIRNFEHGKKR